MIQSSVSSGRLRTGTTATRTSLTRTRSTTCTSRRTAACRARLTSPCGPPDPWRDSRLQPSSSPGTAGSRLHADALDDDRYRKEESGVVEETDIKILTRDPGDTIRYSNQPSYNATIDDIVPGASHEVSLPGRQDVGRLAHAPLGLDVGIDHVVFRMARRLLTRLSRFRSSLRRSFSMPGVMVIRLDRVRCLSAGLLISMSSGSSLYMVSLMGLRASACAVLMSRLWLAARFFCEFVGSVGG